MKFLLFSAEITMSCVVYRKFITFDSILLQNNYFRFLVLYIWQSVVAEYPGSHTRDYYLCFGWNGHICNLRGVRLERTT